MLVYVNYMNTIIDLDECEEEIIETFNNGYYSRLVKYTTPNSDIFYIKHSNFSNICDIISENIDNEDFENECIYGEYRQYGEYVGRNTTNDIEIKEERIKEIKNEIEILDEDDDLDEIKELEKEIKELKEEQNEYDAVMETDRTFYCDNIGMGASTQNDFNYKEYDIRGDYLVLSDYAENNVFKLNDYDIVLLAIDIFKNYGCTSGIQFLYKNQNRFKDHVHFI